MGSNVSDEVFQSGPWVGFYNYGAGQPRHRMDLHLTFAGGVMSGEGDDDVGRFLIRGKYDALTRECFWTKTYPGSHDVFYRGFREGKGIWGTWEIGVLSHGGFHIWPKAAGEGDQEHEAFEESQPADAIGIMTPPGPLAPESVRELCEAPHGIFRQAPSAQDARGGRARSIHRGGCDEMSCLRK